MTPEIPELFKKLLNKDEGEILLDDLIIRITKFNKQNKQKELVSEGYGSWIGELVLDGKK